MSDSSLQKAWRGGSYRLPRAEVIHAQGAERVVTVVDDLKSMNDVGSGFIEFFTEKKSILIPARLIQSVELK